MTAIIGVSSGMNPSLPPDLIADAPTLDCLQANLAVLANAAHGPGTALRLGRRLELRWTFGLGLLPTVERPLQGHLDDAYRHLGLAVTSWAEAVPLTVLGSDLRDGRSRFVVADAYQLQWTPYAGRQHMQHSFLIAAHPAGFEITDAYHNETPWGRARPCRWLVADLASLPSHLAHVLTLDAVPLMPDADFHRLSRADVDRYLEALAPATATADGWARLSLEAWLLNRSRATRARWLTHDQDADPGIEGHLREWRLVCERIYLTQRRADRGRSVPEAVFEQFAARLLEDLHFLSSTSPTSSRRAAPADDVCITEPAADHQSRALLVATVARVLQVSIADIERVRALHELPGYSSLRLVQLVEALEGVFEVEFGTDDLDPARLGELGFLQQLLTRARPTDLTYGGHQR